MKIDERWKLIKRGDRVIYRCFNRMGNVTEYEGFVAGIDSDIGITVEFLDQEAMKTTDFCLDPETGLYHIYCLDKSRYFDEDRYVFLFNHVVLEILSGTMTSDRSKLKFSVSLSCAFK